MGCYCNVTHDVPSARNDKTCTIWLSIFFCKRPLGFIVCDGGIDLNLAQHSHRISITSQIVWIGWDAALEKPVDQHLFDSEQYLHLPRTYCGDVKNFHLGA